MRLKLTLAGVKYSKIAINYNHSLATAIYKLLRFGSPEFAAFLHEKGFHANGKTYKLFTHALKFEETSLSGEYLVLMSPKAYLYISSPLIEDFIKNFVSGTFEAGKIEIFSNYYRSLFTIKQAEFVPDPVFTDEMYFKPANQLVLSTGSEVSGKLVKHYFRYDDDIEEINRVFLQNLKNKYRAVYQKEYQGSGVKLRWDEKYIEEMVKSNKRLSKKTAITRDINKPVNVIGILCPFYVEGDPDLIKIGYECGFGENNSMGFGMVYQDD